MGWRSAILARWGRTALLLSHVSHAHDIRNSTSILHEHILHSLPGVGKADSDRELDCRVVEDADYRVAGWRMEHLALDRECLAEDRDCFAEVERVGVGAVESSFGFGNRQAPATGILDSGVAAVAAGTGIDHQPAAVQERPRVGPGRPRRVSKLKACVRAKVWVGDDIVVVVGNGEKTQRQWG